MRSSSMSLPRMRDQAPAARYSRASEPSAMEVPAAFARRGLRMPQIRASPGVRGVLGFAGGFVFFRFGRRPRPRLMRFKGCGGVCRR